MSLNKDLGAPLTYRYMYHYFPLAHLIGKTTYQYFKGTPQLYNRPMNNIANPSSSLDAVTKQYVDKMHSGINWLAIGELPRDLWDCSIAHNGVVWLMTPHGLQMVNVPDIDPDLPEEYWLNIEEAEEHGRAIEGMLIALLQMRFIKKVTIVDMVPHSFRNKAPSSLGGPGMHIKMNSNEPKDLE